MSIATSLQKVLDSKEAIKTSINNKGGQITSATPFSAYSAAIDNLPSGGGGDGMVKSLSESEFTGNILTKCINVITGVTTPSGVTSYGQGAFDGFINLKRVNSDTDGVANLPSGMTTLPNTVFQNCKSLEVVNLPNGMESIGNSCFQNCSGLTSVTIPSSVTTINNSAFKGTGLKSVTLPSGTTINSSAFDSCNSLSSVTFNGSVTFAGDAYAYTFNGCSALTNIDFPSGTAYIPGYFVSECRSLTSFTIPEGVTSIKNRAFNHCGLTSITLPDSLITIEAAQAFGMCYYLTSVTFGSGLQQIGQESFYYCSGMTSFDIPSGVTSIGANAFANCTSLTAVTVNAVTPPTLGSSVFNNTNNCPIYVPAESVEAYKGATNWSAYASRIQAIPSA